MCSEPAEQEGQSANMEQRKSFTLLIETYIKKEVELSLSLSNKEDGSSLVFLICGWSRPLVLIYALKD